MLTSIFQILKMKRSILIILAAFILLPLAAAAEPDKQPVSLTDEERAIAQYMEEEGSSNASASKASVNSSARWQDYVYEMESDTVKEDNLDDTREAIAEDILINQ